MKTLHCSLLVVVAILLICAPVCAVVSPFFIMYGRNYPADVVAFINSTYAGAIGDANGTAPGVTIPKHYYTNYYCLYENSAEYLDAQAWAKARGVSFEAFFVHRPDGSRVITYNTAGRVVMNASNSNYRAWKIDWLKRQIALYNDAGLFIDNTRFNGLTAVSGSVIEYPSLAQYGNDLLKLFAEAHAAGLVQIPNMAGADDPRVYPYIDGIFREFLINPTGTPAISVIDKNLSRSTAAGLVNYWGGAIKDGYQMAGLSEYYTLMHSPLSRMHPNVTGLRDSAGKEIKGSSVDPRINQWYGAVAVDIGNPTSARYVLKEGIDPCATLKDSMSATVAQQGTTPVWRLTDTSKSWSVDRWKNQYVQFPSGQMMKVYRSGPNFVDLYRPVAIPKNGTYSLGNLNFIIYARQYERALVLFRPRINSLSLMNDASAVTVPATGSPLAANGTTGTSVSAATLWNGDGMVLVK